MRLVGSAEMREIDRTAIERFGIPALTLMDRAGRAVSEAARELAGPHGRVVVVCGGGNNGGDGYVAARLLRAAGRDARVVALVPADRLPPDARAVREQAERSGVPIDDSGELADFEAGPEDVVVDALLGTGLARAPEGPFAEAIARVVELRAHGARVLAVDVPSGLSADTGRPLGACVRADRTVTFGFMKRGLFIHPGVEYAGEVMVADIGIPTAAAERVPVSCEALAEEEARALLPPRRRDAHKGDAGRVLVVAGSPGKTGAAHLALTGALRGGAGLVTLAARPEVLPLALAGRPEAMSLALPGDGPLGRADLDALAAAARGMDALVIGPGIPRGPETAGLLRAFLERARLPAALDADALNALAEVPTLLERLPPGLVLTPHPGEMARLAGIPVEAVQDDRIGVAASRARAWGAAVVLKGARTVVADPSGPPAVIPTGNPGMASGGTGDVLAGLTGALLAGGLDTRAAARVGAWVHGRAGDLGARRFGERGLLAGDLAEALGEVWVEWGR
ncbi:MAG TPA: NAD(P)H-hydrate dehydratase [Anaeromyxobacteraceae bacterium]|nr:NAD(P)H-hydrate dehydratase [Anaeromyxobacteraceae bacterium]